MREDPIIQGQGMTEDPHIQGQAMTEDPHIQGQAMTEDLIITVDDVIKAGHCVVPGLRDWCAAHGLDFRTFVKTGYPASTLLATGDALAVRVLALKESCHGG